MTQTMIQQEWNCFAKTGKIADYLCYREAERIFAGSGWADELSGKPWQKDEKAVRQSRPGSTAEN